MAFLRRIPGRRVWVAGFYDPTGKRRQKSTGTRNKIEARKIAEAWEKPWKEKSTASQVLDVAFEMYRQITGESAPRYSLKEYAEAWLTRKANEVQEATADFYRSIVNRFIDHMGERANMPMHSIEQRHVEEWKDARIKDVGVKTVNHNIKALRTFFKDARRERIITENPVEFVKGAVRQNSDKKEGARPFTLPEIKAVLAVCNDEWRSMCKVALYTGQRLGDVAMLTWAQIDLFNDIVKFTTRKTGRFQELPIPAPLRDHLLTLPAGDDPTAYIHPHAADTVSKTGKSATLSVQFAAILSAAGLREAKTHKKQADGPGRDGRKQRNPITFHSFRHTATSLMKNAGIPAAVVQDYIGHDSAEMSRLYTSIDMDAKRRAASALPSIEESTSKKEE